MPIRRTAPAMIAAPALFAALALGAPAVAQDGGDLPAPVMARQSHMHLYAFNLGVLGDMAKGETEYDAEAAQAAARNIGDLGELTQDAYWVDGTSSEDVEGSRAKPALFEEYGEYEKLTRDLVEAAAAMESAAGESAEAIGGQMRELGGACGACHKLYRESDD